MSSFLDQIYFQNHVRDYLIALGIILIGSFLIGILKKRFFVRIKQWSNRTDTNFDDFIVDAIDRFGIPALHFTVIYIGLSYLTFTARGEKILDIATIVVITFLFIRLLSAVILILLKSYVRRQERGDEKVKQLGGLMIIINVVIWIIGILFLFDNMGYDVTAMVTGLGIGGIAVALAAQNILGDLFNYFVIFLDRPFEVNDFIIVDDKMGTVEYIGIKTTRVKSLSGEQLVFSNSDLTNSRIHNYKRMERRRIVFSVRVDYNTSSEKIKQIPAILKAAVENRQNVIFDRAHLLSFGESSLNFEIVYIVLSSDFNVYMDIQQAINFDIHDEFSKREINFAPTTYVYLKKEESERELANSQEAAP